nr:ABC transporter substrate-binding protein [Actinospica durhamensis]
MMNHRTIRVGALAPLSRPGFLEAGRHIRAGVELAVTEINEAGGVDGRPLELLLRDTAGTPARAADAVRAFVDEGAVAVVGEYHSVVAHAAAGVAVEVGLPFVCSSAVLDAVVDAPTDMVARIAPAQSYCWRVYADFLVAAGYREVALVVQPDLYWSSGARVLKASLAERGVAVSVVEFDAWVVDALVADVVLLLVGYPEPAVSLVKAVRADPRLAGVRIGDPAGRVEFPEWAGLVGEAGADIPFLRYMPPELPPLGVRVAEGLAGLLGERPSFVAFEGYDAVQVVAEALRVGGLDRRGAAAGLGSPGLRVAGTRGTIGFSRDVGDVLQWAWPPVHVAA